MTTLRRVLPLAVAFLLLATGPALAQSAALDTFAHASFETATPGGFQEGECGVFNVGTEPVLVQMSASVTYADGREQSVFRPGQPILLGPDEGFVLSIFFAVAQDAALGTATFTCTFRALGGGGAFVETATDTFEVVPA